MRCAWMLKGLGVWSDIPIHDDSFGDHDILQVTDIVAGDAEVLQAVATVVVRDLYECTPFRQAALAAKDSFTTMQSSSGADIITRGGLGTGSTNCNYDS